VKLITALLMLIDIVVGTFIFINLIVAVAANTLVSIFCWMRPKQHYIRYTQDPTVSSIFIMTVF